MGPSPRTMNVEFRRARMGRRMQALEPLPILKQQGELAKR